MTTRTPSKNFVVRRAKMCSEVFDFIVRFKTEHRGDSPKYREIMEALGYSSTSVVKSLLGDLEAAGMIKRGPRESARIDVGGRWEHVKEPVSDGSPAVDRETAA